MVNKIFKDKIIIITGASSGLGVEIANYFSKQDAKIIVCARNLQKLKKNFYFKKNKKMTTKKKFYNNKKADLQNYKSKFKKIKNLSIYEGLKKTIGYNSSI